MGIKWIRPSCCMLDVFKQSTRCTYCAEYSHWRRPAAHIVTSNLPTSVCRDRWQTSNCDHLKFSHAFPPVVYLAHMAGGRQGGRRRSLPVQIQIRQEKQGCQEGEGEREGSQPTLTLKSGATVKCGELKQETHQNGQKCRPVCWQRRRCCCGKCLRSSLVAGSRACPQPRVTPRCLVNPWFRCNLVLCLLKGFLSLMELRVSSTGLSPPPPPSLRMFIVGRGKCPNNMRADF